MHLFSFVLNERVSLRGIFYMELASSTGPARSGMPRASLLEEPPLSISVPPLLLLPGFRDGLVLLSHSAAFDGT